MSGISSSGKWHIILREWILISLKGNWKITDKISGQGLFLKIYKVYNVQIYFYSKGGFVAHFSRFKKNILTSWTQASNDIHGHCELLKDILQQAW